MTAATEPNESELWCYCSRLGLSGALPTPVKVLLRRDSQPSTSAPFKSVTLWMTLDEFA